MKNPSLLILLALLSFTSVSNAQEKKVRKSLFIGLDGVRSDAIQQANTPTIDSFIASNSLVTYDSWHCGTTVSGPSWSDMLCGVWEAKHGVTNNSFSGANYKNYPLFPKRAKEIYPNLNVVMVVDWAPLKDNTFNDGFNKKIVTTPDGNAENVASAAITQLQNNDLDAMFLYFDAPDLAGHNTGFSTANPSYLAAINRVDSNLKKVFRAIRNRPNFINEEWMILMSTDHGGTGTGHGGNSDAERHLWWFGSGSALKKGLITAEDPGSYVKSPFTVDKAKLAKAPVQTDIAVTMLHHMIYESGIIPDTVKKWNLDGKSWLIPYVAPADTTTKDTTVKDTTSTNSIIPQTIKGKTIVWPNPTTDIVTVWFEDGFSDGTTVRVYDIKGRMIDTDRIRITTNYKANINLDGLSRGTYYIQIKSEKSNITKSVILK